MLSGDGLMTDTSPANAGRMQGGRFPKGASGNPAGKARGTRNKVTVACEGLMGQYAHQVTARVVKRAAEGDMAAARLILDRVKIHCNVQGLPIDLARLARTIKNTSIVEYQRNSLEVVGCRRA
jgi:hypothetical protein